MTMLIAILGNHLTWKKDVGVHVTNELEFSRYIEHQVSKASRIHIRLCGHLNMKKTKMKSRVF